MKERAIPCLHQPPTRVDNTVSVVQGSTATPGATKQLLSPNRVFKRNIYINIYIYIYELKCLCIYIYIYIYIYILHISPYGKKKYGK